MTKQLHFWIINCLNSPGLWPTACQILDMSQSINESINQSTHQPKHESINQWTLESEAIYCFLEWPGANYGGRLGGSPRPTARADRGRRHSNFVLKSHCFLIHFFSNFLSIWVAKVLTKSTKILNKCSSKSHLIFVSFSIPFFIIFSWIFAPSGHRKSS